MNDKIYVQIGVLMEKHGLTNEMLAAKTGISVGTISGIRSGKNKTPSFDSICAIMKAMGESIDALVGIIPPVPELKEEELDADGYTESEKKAILRWAGNEIARSYQAVISVLEARISEKESRITDTDAKMAEVQATALEELHIERKRARQATWISYATLGLFVVLFFVDFLIPTRGWIIR